MLTSMLGNIQTIWTKFNLVCWYLAVLVHSFPKQSTTRHAPSGLTKTQVGTNETEIRLILLLVVWMLVEPSLGTTLTYLLRN